MEAFVGVTLLLVGAVIGGLRLALSRGVSPAQKHGFFLAVSSRGKVPVGEVAGFTPLTRAAAAADNNSAASR